MTDWLFSWVKDIAVYLILITAVVNVIPNNSYKKYIRFFTGMVLILLLVSPLVKLFRADELLDFNFGNEVYKQEIASVRVNGQYFESAQSDYLTGAYAREAAEKISQIVEENGMYPISVIVDMETDVNSESFGAVSQVNIAASYEEQAEQNIQIEKIEIGESRETADSYEQIKIKNEIKSFYNIGHDNINISIQR